MFFLTPDGDRYTAKRTKRGQHQWALMVECRLFASNGPDAGRYVSRWFLQSQHLTEAAANKAMQKRAAEVVREPGQGITALEVVAAV